MRVRFYNPHPGFLGAAARCPEAVLAEVQALDGQEADLDEALAKIRNACPGAVVEASLEAEPMAVLVTRKTGRDTHTWRVIQFDHAATPLR